MPPSTRRPVCVMPIGQARRIKPDPNANPVPEARGLGWLGKGIVGLARHYAKIDRVPDEVRDTRLAICRSCPQFTPKGDSGTCKLCGCGMSAKCSDAKARCPLPAPRWLEWSA